jgi:hypothetical protein
MSKLGIPILGKKLMERWEIDAYELLQIMKEKKIMPLGSFNTQVEVTRLYSSQDVPRNYEQLLESLQLPWSFVEEIERESNILYPKPEVKGASENKVSNLNSTDEKSIENFIKNLRFSYENDSEIKIQQPNKKAKNFNYNSLGFNNNRTKQWKAFLKLLQDPDPYFNIGRAGTAASAERKNYESNKKLLTEINNKLIKFLNQNYPISIPPNFKLYKKCPEEGQGVYKFMFIVENEKLETEALEKEFKKMSDEDLKNALINIAEKYRKTSDESYAGKIVAAANVAKERGIVTDQKLQELVEPDRSKEEYK